MHSQIAKTLAPLALTLGFAASAHAIPVTINMTADNIVDSGGLCDDASCTFGTGWAALGGLLHASDWQQSDSITIDLGPGTYHFAWFVMNLGAASSSNPAGLLAEILWAGNANYSSSAWEVYDRDTTGAFIANATEYGANGGANIWTTVNGGAVGGISTNAQWIYTANNFAQADQGAWFRTSITVVPEPAALGLFGIGLLALGFFRRRIRG